MNNLVTLDEYKSYKGKVNTEQDARIEQIITSVSSLVREYCSRLLLNEDSQTQYDNGGSSIIYTREFPIISVTSVERSIDYGQTYTALTVGTDYVIDMKRDALYVITEDGTEYVNKYKIAYTAGYDETPSDLKLAVLDLVDYYMNNESVPKRMSNFVTIEYVKTSDFPPHIKRVLDLYRVV